MLIGIFYSQIVESSSLVSVLFREAISHPYISFFHLLVNDFSVIHVQFSSCDSLQNRESCRDKLYKTSRQRWCDELDVCLHPSSGDTFLSICLLLQLNRGNNHFTIVADPSTFLCWFYTVISIVQLKNACKRIHIHA